MTFPVSYEPITLDRMTDSKLMDRVDTKYVTTTVVLQELLARAAPFYYVLVTGNKELALYRTLYFDTDDRAMYIMHQNGHLNRVKVRTRTYGNTGESYLEIKRKNNHRRTKKKRMLIPGDTFTAPFGADGAGDFLLEKSGYSAALLTPALSTDFTRITLVSKSGGERITIDFDLHFTNWRNGVEQGLGPAAILELKRSGSVNSKMAGILQDLHVHPFRVSKYCIGTALTDPSAKQNRFKTKIRQINRITNASTVNNAGI